MGDLFAVAFLLACAMACGLVAFLFTIAGFFSHRDSSRFYMNAIFFGIVAAVFVSVATQITGQR